MHIKQVIISGFRSFRNQNEIESFSSGHNAIVGRNGSGKSNFFDAIQFVLLAPKFSNLRQEDRQHLLHEGAGSSVMAAYVEIIFDNSDGRLSIESDEVLLRRTVGHKKDEFFINRKRVQKSEVLSMLESAGFSKSNPYYIVQQGKVANLCIMKDADRLNLLKEVAGTTVFEDRRAESLKIMQESVSKQDQILEVLTFIDERLNELDKEKEELKAYEALDKQHRALEYNLYDKELQKSSEQLNQIEITKVQEHERQQELFVQYTAMQDALQVEEAALAKLKEHETRMSAKRSEKMVELNALLLAQSSMSVTLNEMSTSGSRNDAEYERLKGEMDETLLQIREQEDFIANVQPEYDMKNAAFAKCVYDFDHDNARIEALTSKRGRGKHFTTKKERDAYLLGQIKLLHASVSEKSGRVDKLSAEIEKDEQRLVAEKQAITKASSQIAVDAKKQTEMSASIQDRILARNQLQEQRKLSWKREEDLQESLRDTALELDKGKQLLNVALPKHITIGLATVAQCAAEMKLTGYYGPIIENMRLRSDAFRTAVEVAGGNSLFHIIVDTDATAATLMKELERRKGGRLTFLPLNRLRNDTIVYPDSTDVKPLMDVTMEFDPKFHAAFQQVFGKKLLARDLETAAHFSKEANLDALTTDGDVVSRKGGFEGGYRDERYSRIGSFYKIREALQTLAELKKTEVEYRAEQSTCDAQIVDVLREIQQLEGESLRFRNKSSQLSQELTKRGQQVDIALGGVTNKKLEVQTLEGEVEKTRVQITTYEAEKSSPLLSKLSEQEQAELGELEKRFAARREAKDAAEKEVLSVSSQHDKYKFQLKDNLLKRKIDLELQLQEVGQKKIGDQCFDAELSTLQMNIDQNSTSLLELQDECAQLASAVVSHKKEVVSTENSVEKRRQEELKSHDALQQAAKMHDKLLNRRSMLSSTILDKQRLIRDLGNVPKKEVEDFRQLGEKQLLQKLKEVNEKIKLYGSVNRKALDQYLSFNEQRESLMGRKDTLEQDYEAIQTLVQSLDQQKEESILRTFRNVSEFFSDVFSELVSGGKGEMVMLTGKSSEDNTPSSLTPADVNNSAIDTFQGVQIRVSFSGSGQQYELQQLSGGQKALVALALIFAIQRSDPAPFYLFDEIDQALDANYRSGVARLIQKQVHSKDAPAQFITTTFRPELVNAAQKCYGIALENKVSNIYSLDKSEAQSFVANLMTEEEAVGGVTSLPSGTGAGSVSSPNSYGSPKHHTAAHTVTPDDTLSLPPVPPKGRKMSSLSHAVIEEEEEEEIVSKRTSSRIKAGRQ